MDWNALLYPTATAFGMALVHSVWIGVLIYCLVRTLLPLLPSSAARHHLAYAGLLTLGVAFAVVFYRYFDPAPLCENLGVTTLNLADLGQYFTTETAQLTPRERLTALFTEFAPVLSVLYLVGLLPALFRLAGDYRYSRRLQTTGLQSFPAVWAASVASELAGHPATRRVRCYLSERATEVMTVGFWSPVIVFPVALAVNLSPAMARTILLHEIAHLRGYDHLLNYPQQLLRTFFFYHPAARALCRIIDREREHRCDDWVAARCSDRRTYASALVAVARFSQSPPNALVMSATKTPFSARIHRLFAPSARQPRQRLFGLGLLALVAAGHLSYTSLGADAGAVKCLEEQGSVASPAGPELNPVVADERGHEINVSLEELSVMAIAGVDQPVRFEPSPSLSAPPAVTPLPASTNPTPLRLAVDRQIPTVRITPAPAPEFPIATTVSAPDSTRPAFLAIRDNSRMDQPIYVINGDVITAGEVNTLVPDQITAISVIKGDSARERYGEEGVRRGVVEITAPGWTNPAPATRTLNGDKLAPGNFSDQYAPYTLRADGKVGYLLNGKKVRYARIRNLRTEDILTVEVFEGRESAARLGFRKMNGVVKVTMR